MTLTAALAVLICVGEWTGLARAITGGPYLAAVLDAVLIGLFGVTVIRAWRQDRLHPVLLDWLLAAFFVLALVQILNPNVPGLVVGLEGFRKTAFTMLAYGVVRFSSGQDASSFYHIVAVGSVPALLWAIRQFVMPWPIDLRIVETSGVSPIGFRADDVVRAFSPTAGPFHLGIIAGSVLVIATVFAVARSRWFVIPALIASVALGCSLTRANIAGTIVAIVTMMVLWAPREARRRFAMPAMASIAALVITAVIAAGSPTDPASQPSGAGDPPPAETPGGPVEGFDPLDQRNLLFRFEYWREFLVAIAERPLLGYGTSSAADGFGADYEGTGSRNFGPHSIYFKPALESGIPGFVLFVAIGLLLLRQAFRVLPLDGPLGFIGLGLITLLAVSGISGPMLDAYPFNVLAWATAGWLVARTTAAAQPATDATAAASRPP